MKNLLLLAFALFMNACAMHPAPEQSDDFQVYHATPGPINMLSPYVAYQAQYSGLNQINYAQVPLSANVYTNVSSPLSYRGDNRLKADEEVVPVVGQACQRGLVLFNALSFFWGDGSHTSAIKRIEAQHDAKVVRLYDVKEDTDLMSFLIFGKKCLKISALAVLAKK